MKTSCIKAIVRKDSAAALRNKLLVLGLFAGIIFSVMYYVLPSTVEETFDVALYDEGSSQLFSQITGTEGMQMTLFTSDGEFEKAVEEEDYAAGIALPKNFDSQLLSGEQPVITLYFKSNVPESTRTSIEHFMRMTIEYVAHGEQPMDIETEMLGEDMAGEHIPLREQSLPFFLVFALMMEMWTISTLIVEESAFETMKAVLVSPASPSDVILSKGIVGVGYSLIVAVSILILTQSVRGNLPLLFLGVLLGAVMAVSMGLFLGSLTKNILGSYIYVAIPLFIFILPGMFIFVPGVSLSIVKAIPTYYLADAFEQLLNRGAGLVEVWKDLLIIAGFDTAFFVLGVYALRRRFS
ncbi:MAG: ABC transporter permease [Euryarchaeota archaeon]|nr:ABC transporter permease [Euryarchaeota archaeon]